MKRFVPRLLAVLLFVSPSLAPLRAQGPQTPPPSPSPQQQQPPTPAPQADDEDEVVRITSNLVQFDAVVLDKQGRQVTDLRPEDFEVTLGGERQEITNFSYVSNVVEGAARPAEARTATDPNAPPVPPARLRPSQVRRTIALVVDDLGTSFESTAFVRDALKKYVDRQMQPGDLVAIIRTSAGMGALQQFTSDKRQLHAAIERVRWYPMGRSGVGIFQPLEGKPLPDVPRPDGGGREEGEEEARERRGGGVDEFREEVFAVGTLGALNFIVKGMKELPGRKSIVMFSEGFSIFRREDLTQSARIIEGMRRLADLANRASVVIYTIDARGLPFFGLSAADNTSGMTSMEIERAMSDRSARYLETQDAMRYLAQETGGFFVRNTNDLAGGVQRVLDDQRGFYLIGFRPDEETFDPVKGRRRFNRVEVKVKRAGLRVRTRGGFYGFTEEEAARPVRRTRAEQLIGALTSPFASGDVRLRLTSLFGGDGEKANFVASLMHIDMSNVKFTEQPDGWHKAELDVIAITFGENGNVVDEVNRTETVRARGGSLRAVLEGGLVYTMRVPVRKPGAYQLRVAVRDAATEKLGSASQFIEVPDLRKKRLALSGILLEGSAPATTQAAPAAPKDTAPASAQQQQQQQQGTPVEGQGRGPDPMSSAAVRRFRQGTTADYFVNIYNAKLDKASGRPQLKVQMRLFREGQPAFTGQVQPFNPERTTATKFYTTASRIRLGSDLPPGEYVLQVVVTDTLAKGRHAVTSQWIDFEIVK